MRRTCPGSPYPALASKRIIVKPLQDSSLAILNHPYAAKMVRNLIDWFIASGTEDKREKIRPHIAVRPEALLRIRERPERVECDSIEAEFLDSLFARLSTLSNTPQKNHPTL